MNAIVSFTGEYAFLSNFYGHPMTVLDVEVKTLEHAFQAAKAGNPADWHKIATAPSAREAKRLGRTVPLRLNWERLKIPVMRELLAIKFPPGSDDLSAQLKATGNALLMEGNLWGDTFWGVYLSKGENWLGHLLMARRAELRSGAW